MTVLGSSSPPPIQTPKNNQNDSLGSVFVTALGSSWGPPSQALKIAQNDSLGTFCVTVLGSSALTVPDELKNLVFMLDLCLKA